MKKPKQGGRKGQKELAKADKNRFPKLQQINLRHDRLGLLLLMSHKIRLHFSVNNFFQNFVKWEKNIKKRDIVKLSRKKR